MCLSLQASTSLLAQHGRRRIASKIAIRPRFRGRTMEKAYHRESPSRCPLAKSSRRSVGLVTECRASRTARRAVPIRGRTCGEGCRTVGHECRVQGDEFCSQ
jgi:hypothetical protein